MPLHDLLTAFSIQPESTPTLSVSAAAGQLSVSLDALGPGQLSAEMAQSVGSFVSQLIDAQQVGGTGTGSTDTSFDERTSAELQGALVKLATAAAAPTGGAALQVRTPNLNLTVQSFATAGELGSAALDCPSPDGGEATAALPAGLLDGIAGVDPALPVAALLYVTTANLHARPSAASALAVPTPQATPSASGRRLPSSSEEQQQRQQQRYNVTGSSPTVSFSLVQAGAALRVQSARARINISIPFQPSEPSACIGGPMGEEDELVGASTGDQMAVSAACRAAVQCRYWDTSSQVWSAAGCKTVPAEGNGDAAFAQCSCTHLTDFVLIEFRSDGLLEDIATALAAFHGFTPAAGQCLAAGPDFATIPFGWYAIAAVLSFNVLGLLHAFRRDRNDVKRVSRQKARMSSATVLPAASPPAPDGTDQTASPQARLQPPGDQDGEEAYHHARVPPPEDPSETAPGEEVAATACCRSTSPSSSPIPSPPPYTEGEAPRDAEVETLRDTSATRACSLEEPTDQRGYLRHAGGRVLRLGALRSVLHPFAAAAATSPPPPSERVSAKARWSQVTKAHLQRPKGSAASRAAAGHFARRAGSTAAKLALAFKSRHTLLAGLFYNGALGYTRAQTLQVLSNSLALELVLVSMTFSLPDASVAPAYVIQPIVVIVHGLIAGLICIPGMVLSAWLFDVDIVGRLAIRILIAPVYLGWHCVRRACCGQPAARVAPEASSLSSGSESSRSTRLEHGESTSRRSGRGGFRRRRRRMSEEHGAKIGIVGMCLAAVARERQRSRRSLGETDGGQRLWDRLRLPLGWLLNWILLFALLFLFVTYLCEFSVQPNPLLIQRELLWTWGFSITQRFLINEPLIIIASKLGPKILRSKIWYACFSERCVEGSSAFVFSVINAFRMIAAR